MTVRAAFQPKWGGGSLLTAGAASQSTPVDANSKAVCFHNQHATQIAYVRIGKADSTGAIPAAVVGTDYPIAPSSKEVVSKQQGDDTCTYIATGAATPLHMMPGEGQ